MKVLLDTNVALDFLQAREPFAAAARQVFMLSNKGKAELLVTAKQISDIYYISSRELHSKNKAREIITGFIKLVEIIDATSEDVYNSLLDGHPDFEDGLIIAAAVRTHAEAIVTRDAEGFANSDVPPMSPYQFIAQFG